MARIYDCSVDTDLLTGMRLARQAVGRGEVIVIPTDTVYGVAADAFNPEAVARLLEAKGRGRDAPPPVLIPGQSTLDALAEFVPEVVRRLVEEFWPGGLTVILVAQPSLVWDLGDTRGTVALRMPANSYALELLAETGPLAVSSANRTGEPAAVTAQEAADQLGDSVSLFLDGGAAGGAASTIVDASRVTEAGGRVRIVREGAITRAQIQQLIGDELEPVVSAPSDDAPAGDAPADDVPAGDVPAGDVPAGDAPAAETPRAGTAVHAAPAAIEFVEAVPVEPAPAEAAPVSTPDDPPADPPAPPR